jgi:hypothetical protein
MAIGEHPEEPAEKAATRPVQGPPPFPGSEEVTPAAKIERYRAETDGIIARNEAARSRTSRDDSERKKLTKVTVKERETRRTTIRDQTYVFTAVTVVGVVMTVVTTALAVAHHEPVLFSGTGAGLLVGGGGIFKLHLLKEKHTSGAEPPTPK